MTVICRECLRFSQRANAIDVLNQLYTILGRADLLYFENWIKKFRELNDTQIDTYNEQIS